MPSQLNWIDSEKTILDINLGDKWDWNDFDVARYRSFEMIRGVSHKVDIIIHDNAPNEPLPRGNALKHMQSALKALPHNVDLIAIQANDLITKTFVGLVTKISKQFYNRIVVVSSVNEGVEMLRKRHRDAPR
jgi:hypothetical protein